MSGMATSAPSLAMHMAMPSPMPEPPPVTTATLPWSLIVAGLPPSTRSPLAYAVCRRGASAFVARSFVRPHSPVDGMTLLTVKYPTSRIVKLSWPRRRCSWGGASEGSTEELSERARCAVQSPSRLSRSDLEPRHHDGELGVAAGITQQTGRFPPFHLADLGDQAPGPRPELGRARSQVHHAVAVDPAKPGEGGRGEGVERELGGGARLESRRPRQDLRSDGERDDHARGRARHAWIRRHEH